MFKKLQIVLLLVCMGILGYPADAPVTTTGSIINAIPGTSPYSIPVTVNSFDNIGQFTLTLVFDVTRLTYLSSTGNPSLIGMNINYIAPSGNTLAQLILTWTGGTNVSLTDGSSLALISFSYLTGTGILSWDYNYSTCQYKRYSGGNLILLNDDPKYLFYQNGGISSRGAPYTYAPALTLSAAGSFQLPVTVNAFIGIGGFTLHLEYDPAIITYQNSYTKNAAFGSNFVVGNQPGTNGKMEIIIQWYTSSSVTLGNGATLCTLDFTYQDPNLQVCPLTWFDRGPTCEYTDGSGDVLIDMPTGNYYFNGSVGPPVVAVSVIPSQNPACSGLPVTFTAIPVNGGTAPAYQWKLNGANTGIDSPQCILTPVNGDVITCQITSSEPFVSGSPATSSPVTMVVLTLPAVNADFTAGSLQPLLLETVLLTDLSTGDPVAWEWSFDRSSVEFVNGTDATSQNPEVQFTEKGPYAVTLHAYHECSEDVEIKTAYIHAGNPGLWTGLASAAWDDPLNWDNELVPYASNDIVIPSDALNWPVFESDFTVGVQCRSLTLQGPTSRMTVNGHFSIP